jgi:hypothetical protein
VQERDPAVAQVVWRERRDPGGGAGARDRGAEAVAAEPWKTGRSGVRSSRATSPQTASNSTGGTFTQRARLVLETA